MRLLREGGSGLSFLAMVQLSPSAHDPVRSSPFSLAGMGGQADMTPKAPPLATLLSLDWRRAVLHRKGVRKQARAFRSPRQPPEVIPRSLLTFPPIK